LNEGVRTVLQNRDVHCVGCTFCGFVREGRLCISQTEAVRDSSAFLLLASVARQTIFLRLHNGLRCDDIASGLAAVGATAIPVSARKGG